MEIQRMQAAAQIKTRRMQIQHQYDMQLKQMDVESMKQKENRIEDRKIKNKNASNTTK